MCPPTFCSLCLACWNTLPAVLTNLSQTVKQFVFTAAVASFDSNTCNSAMAILLYFIVCEKNCCSEIGNCHRDTIKFLEAIPQISSVATNVIKLPSQKMVDTSKDKLLLGGGIRHVTVCRCIMRSLTHSVLRLTS